MSVKIDPHDEVPTCNSFQAIVRNDQLCFEVDLNRFSNKENIEKELSTGFFFIMDYNEDRQVYDYNNETLLYSGLFDRIDKGLGT